MFRPWLSELQRRFSSFRRHPRRRDAELRPSQPRLEHLEVRLLPSTFTVLNTGDSGAGSLRQAILDSNSAGGSNTITFNIAASGVQTITPLSALPNVTASVVIDATTEPGYAGAPIVALTSGSAGSGVSGLTITAANSTVQGLIVNDFTGNGIVLTGAGASGDLIAGNYIGTDPSGTTQAANGGEGVAIQGGASGDTVGDTTTAAHNVISGNGGDGVYIDGNSSANLVAGNSIGTDTTGTALLSNNSSGVFVQGAANTVGGTAAGAGNVIAGSGYAGVRLNGSAATGNAVQGNYIGLNAAGTAKLGSLAQDIGLEVGASNNLIGTTGGGGRNVLDGAAFNAISIYNDGTNNNTVAGNYIGTDATGAVALGDANGIGFGYMYGNVGAANTVISGNVISGNGTGISIDTATHNTSITGNRIGTNAAGTAALANGTGVFVNGHNNTVGGTMAAARNLISGNNGVGVLIRGSSATGNLVAGNYVGTDINGTAALGNLGNGVQIDNGATANTVGGTVAGAGNVLSANGSGTVNCNGGLWILGAGTSGNLVEGNYIGTDKTGTAALGNKWTGLAVLAGATNNTIGGTVPGSADVISANAAVGVEVQGAGVSGNVVEGNLIGTDATGTGALGNTLSGVQIWNAATNNTLGGSAAGARNVISGNANHGVLITNAGTTGNVVAGNYIGTNAAGTAALPNSWSGVAIASGAQNNLVGTNGDGVNDALERNVISGNALVGVWLTDGDTTGNVVAGNYIGINPAGSAALANGWEGVALGGGATRANVVAGNQIGLSAAGGPLANSQAGVLVDGGAANNSVGGSAAGLGNAIAFNTTDGVVVSGATSNGTTVVGNSIHDNGGLGIDLGGTALSVPGLLSFIPGLPTTVSGRYGTTAGVTFTLDLYSNPGAVYIGSQSVTTADGGAFSVTLPGASLPSQILYATATDTAGNTSEFGASLAFQGYSNTSPTVAINGPSSPIVGAPVSLNSVVRDPTPNKTYTYAWTLTHTGDPTFALPAGTVTSAPNLVFVPTAAGNYVATLQVTDNLGGTGSATFPINVGVPGPGVVIQVQSSSVNAGTTVNLISSVSEPSGATPTTYAWSVTLNGAPFTLPAGTATNQPNFSFQPNASGLYGVSLNVTDSAGGTGGSSIYLSVTGGASATAPPAVAPPVAGRPPSPVITQAPSGAAAGSTITLTASAPANATLSWGVSLNGQAYTLPAGAVTNQPTFSFLAANVGLYVVTITATNAAGKGSAVAAITVGAATVPVTLVPGGPFQQNAPASVTAQVANAASGVTYTFHFSLTGSPSSSSVTTLSPSSASFGFVPTAAGPYTVAVTVNGSDGSSGTTSQTFSVAAPPSLPASTPAPTVTISGAPAAATLGASYSLTGSTNASGATLHWQVINQATGRTATATGANFTYAPLAAGTEVVTLTATDSLGNVLASGSVTVQVSGALTLALAPTGALQPWVQDQVQATVNGPATGVTYTFSWSVTGQGGVGFAASGPGTTSGAGSSFAFKPLATGSYLVGVTVQGSDGSSGSASQTFSVAPATPLTTALNLPSGGTVSDGTPLELTAQVSGGTTQAAPGVINYQWTVTGPNGFNLTSTAQALDFTAPRWGPYTVALTTTDAAGDAVTTTGNLVVQPVIRNAQVPTFNGPGFTAFLTTTAPAAGSTDVFAFQWTALDDQGLVVAQQPPSPNPNFSFMGMTGRVYTVQLIVHDSHGNTGMAGTPIQVAAPFTTTTLAPPAQPTPQLLVVGGAGSTIDASHLPASVAVVEVASDGGNILIAGPGPSLLIGDTGNNTLQGGTGPDTLIGTGSDTLIGGTGPSNLFEIRQATAVSVQAGTNPNTLNTLSFAQLGGGVSVNLSGVSGLATVAGGTVNLTGAFQAVIGSSAGNNALSASGLSNVLLQAAGANNQIAVTGGSSVTMFGGTGNDTLSSSGATNVTMIAGTGNSSLSAVNGSGVLLQANTPIPTLSSSGGSSITLLGSAGSDTLSSSGGTGITMVGGAGNDSLSSVGGTGVVMQGGTGVVTVPTSAGSSVTLFGGAGNSTLSSSGGTSVTMVGGAGNSTLSSSGGSSVTMFGGSGNSSLSSSGGTSVSMLGGSGNSTLSSSGGSSVTMFGGAGNASLSNSGGSSVSILGGSGNSSLSSSGGTSVTMFGGTGSDSLTSSGGTSLIMAGGTGSDTLSASTASGALIIGGSGNSTLSSSGGTSITMFGGSGNDSLASSGGINVSMTGGSGSDTLTSSGDTSAHLQSGGSSNDSLASSGGTSVTMFGGAGNDTLSANGGTAVGMDGLEGNNFYEVSGSAANPVSVTLSVLGDFGHDQAQTDAQTAGTNTILFPGVTGGIRLGRRGADGGAGAAGGARRQRGAGRPVPERGRHAGRRLDSRRLGQQRAGRRRHRQRHAHRRQRPGDVGGRQR
jgi:titin